MKQGAEPRWLKFLPAGSLVASLAIGLLFLSYVDLVPVIDSNFFFSTDDPEFREEKKAQETFSSHPQVIIVAGSRDIRSARYLAQIEALSAALAAIPGVQSVLSLARGPKDIDDAFKSPLWSRVLISEDRRSSNLILGLDEQGQDKTIEKIIGMERQFDGQGFDLAISGVPFVIYEIKRQLVTEMQKFSAVAIGMFAVLMLLLLRSVPLAFGAIVTCLTTCCLTFVLLQLFGIETGVLTANLWAICFVVTLTHIIHTVANWEAALEREGASPLDAIVSSVKITGPASFWATMTTVLGFLCVMTGSAKPLRQLGLAGAIGTLTSIFVAYLFFPPYLVHASPPGGRLIAAARERFLLSMSKPRPWMPWLMLALCAAMVPAIFLMNTDPSLFAYFKDGQPLREDLEKIDRSGGTSPLELTVRDKGGGKFTTDKAFEKLWNLQTKIENDPSVGSVISLPMLMAEADRQPLAFFLSWENLIRRMEEPKYHRIARTFISKDRTQGRFILRMRETGRKESRGEVIERLEGVVRKSGFESVLTTGLYKLQGQLSANVVSNMVQGLVGLLIVFFAMALWVSRSWRTAGCMIATLFMVPVGVTIIMGYFRLPVDIMSAPAADIALGIGTDDMIHLVSRVRKLRRDGVSEREAWAGAMRHHFKPIVVTALIVIVGFSTFTLSNFPPTQRLGLLVAAGSVIALLGILWILPALACRKETGGAPPGDRA